MIIRRAEDTECDCLLVYNLSNDVVVRQNSFNTEYIEYESHKTWYKNAVQDKQLLFFLFFENSNFVGQMRFKQCQDKKKCTISLSITECYRNRKIGNSVLNLGLSELRREWPFVNFIIAEVKANNIASNKLFERNGFTKIESGEINIYKYENIYHCRDVCKS